MHAPYRSRTQSVSALSMLRRGLSTAATTTATTAINPLAAAIRVGQIVSCEKHPDADKLYVSQIDVGDKLQVCLGLVNYISLGDMQARRVVVVCNLKPLKMRGVKSEAMLLASDSPDGTAVELVEPPASLLVGESLWFGTPPEKAPLRMKPKVWEALQQCLRTDSEGRVVFTSEEDTGVLANDKGEPATVATLRNTVVR